MDRQRDRSGEYPAKALDRFCFSVPCVDIRVQRFYHKIIEEGSDLAHPDDPYSIPVTDPELCLLEYVFVRIQRKVLDPKQRPSGGNLRRI